MAVTDLDVEAARRKYPKGVPVVYQPTKGVNKCEISKVRSHPWRLGSGQIVIMIEGRSGGVSIDHLLLPDASHKGQ